HGPAGHTVVECNRSALPFSQLGIRLQDDVELSLPSPIVFSLGGGRTNVSSSEATTQDEISELALAMAIGAHVPAKSIESECMRRYPPRQHIGIRATHGLVFDQDGAAIPNSSEERAEDSRVDPARRNR